MLIAGVDEAGRGSVVGPLIVACTVFDSEILKSIPVNDSKQLSKKKRETLNTQIYKLATEITICVISAKEITELQSSHTLNEIEVDAFAAVLNQWKSKPDEGYLDAADVN